MIANVVAAAVDARMANALVLPEICRVITIDLVQAVLDDRTAYGTRIRLEEAVSRKSSVTSLTNNVI